MLPISLLALLLLLRLLLLVLLTLLLLALVQALMVVPVLQTESVSVQLVTLHQRTRHKDVVLLAALSHRSLRF
jgi:hypothetical protein